jgi:threonine dehydrogenase-like Zn-dependent dehydrogenase
VRAAIFRGPRDIAVGERPDPVIQKSTDAIVRVVLACVCGSDLWYYRGESPHATGSIGHEFIGVVEETGADVSTVTRGDLVVAPFIYSDMSCPHCQNGSTISCVRRLDRRGAAAHRRRAGAAACGSPPGWITAALHHNVGRPGRG